MSSANVLPSAPPDEPLHPVLAAPGENFRLQKINEIANTIYIFFPTASEKYVN